MGNSSFAGLSLGSSNSFKPSAIDTVRTQPAAMEMCHNSNPPAWKSMAMAESHICAHMGFGYGGDIDGL